jgi:hypothetical protein
MPIPQLGELCIALGRPQLSKAYNACLAFAASVRLFTPSVTMSWPYRLDTTPVPPVHTGVLSLFVDRATHGRCCRCP